MAGGAFREILGDSRSVKYATFGCKMRRWDGTSKLCPLSHRIASHITSIPWHHIPSHDMTWHLATNNSTSTHITSQPTNHITSSHLATNHMTSYHITSPPRTHQGKINSHHRNTATWRNGRRLVHTKNSVWAVHLVGGLTHPYAHSTIGKFFLWLIGLSPPETSAPGSPGKYWYTHHATMYKTSKQ